MFEDDIKWGGGEFVIQSEHTERIIKIDLYEEKYSENKNYGNSKRGQIKKSNNL